MIIDLSTSEIEYLRYNIQDFGPETYEYDFIQDYRGGYLKEMIDVDGFKISRSDILKTFQLEHYQYNLYKYLENSMNVAVVETGRYTCYYEVDDLRRQLETFHETEQYLDMMKENKYDKMCEGEYARD